MLQLRLKPNKTDTSVKLIQWLHDKFDWDMPTTICSYFWRSVLYPVLLVLMFIGLVCGIQIHLTPLLGVPEVYLLDYFGNIPSLLMLIILIFTAITWFIPFIVGIILLIICVIYSVYYILYNTKTNQRRLWVVTTCHVVSKLYRKICPKIDIEG